MITDDDQVKLTERRGHAGKQLRAVRTHGQILNSAAEIFARRGFWDVTLLDIAAHAGVTKGAVYFHFANKKDIAIAVSEEYYVRLAALSEQIKLMRLSPLAATTELITQSTIRLRDDFFFQASVRLHIELFLSESGLPTPFVAYTQLVTTMLTEAKARGELAPSSDPAKIGRVLVASFFGAQHISWVLHDRKDVAERVREVLDLVIAH